MGPAGSLRYSVDNGHGGVVEGSIEVQVGAMTVAANTSSESTLWGEPARQY